jgi:hypothetical protein
MGTNPLKGFARYGLADRMQGFSPVFFRRRFFPVAAWRFPGPPRGAGLRAVLEAVFAAFNECG